jgi:uncharacterized membrane protein
MNTNTFWSNKQKIREMTILAMFIAIIVVMGFVPNLGFITIAGVSQTIIHIPVLIGGVLLGRKNAIILGLTFGLASFFRATTSVGFDFLFIFPWVSILPRFIFGLLIYDVYQLALKLLKKRFVALVVAFFVLTLIHSLMVLPMLWSTFPLVVGNADWGSIVDQNAGTLDYLAANSSFAAGMRLIWSVLIANSVIEALLAASIGAVVADRLMAFRASETEAE